MSFFLPGTTKCTICGLQIAKRIDAARLRYAHPKDVGDVAMHGRSFVHRRCWDEWEHRAAYADSSRQLLLNHDPVEPPHIVTEQDGVLLYDRDFYLEIEDLYAPSDLRLSPPDGLRLAGGLVARLAEASDYSQGVTTALETRRARVEQVGEGISITLLHEGEPYERFVIPPDRQVAWAAIARRAREMLGSAAGAT